MKASEELYCSLVLDLHKASCSNVIHIQSIASHMVVDVSAESAAVPHLLGRQLFYV